MPSLYFCSEIIPTVCNLSTNRTCVLQISGAEFLGIVDKNYLSDIIEITHHTTHACANWIDPHGNSFPLVAFIARDDIVALVTVSGRWRMRRQDTLAEETKQHETYHKNNLLSISE